VCIVGNAGRLSSELFNVFMRAGAAGLEQAGLLAYRVLAVL